MAISVVARKLLWGRAGNRCAWKSCDQRLTVSGDDEEAGILETQGLVLGEEAHIRSSKVDGPRHEIEYPENKLDTYENLILLCPTHHTVIDKDSGAGWPTDKIDQMKAAHELLIDQGRSTVDQRRQLLEERMVAKLAVWEQKLGVDAWDNWGNLTSGLNSAVPEIGAERFSELVSLGQWLLKNTWPAQMPKLKIAFDRHFAVVQSLVSVLGSVMTRRGSGWRLDRLYAQLGRWDTEEYERLLKETNIRVVTLRYLTSELARSANLVIVAAREELEPLYRFDEGMLLTRDGDWVLTSYVVREEYSDLDWASPPAFPTIEQIRSAITEAADPLDTRIGDVDSRALRPKA